MERCFWRLHACPSFLLLYLAVQVVVQVFRSLLVEVRIRACALEILVFVLGCGGGSKTAFVSWCGGVDAVFGWVVAAGMVLLWNAGMGIGRLGGRMVVFEVFSSSDLSWAGCRWRMSFPLIGGSSVARAAVLSFGVAAEFVIA